MNKRVQRDFWKEDGKCWQGDGVVGVGFVGDGAVIDGWEEDRRPLVGMDGVLHSGMPDHHLYRWQTAGVGECSGKRRQRHSPPANRHRSFTSCKLYLPLHPKKFASGKLPKKSETPTWRLCVKFASIIFYLPFLPS
ncbi:hypothetical protein LXL04_012753 [Taraxacum kok-saghyz]